MAKVFYPHLVTALVARYGFQKFPQRLEEFDQVKGVIFAGGRVDDFTIDQVILYTYGILLDTRSSTDVSRSLLEEAMLWASKEMGLVYKPSMIKRWDYTSQISFYSKVDLTSAHLAFQRLAESTSKHIEQTLGERLKYELSGFIVDYDQLARKHPLGRFSIQRRDNTPFSENKYFSDAPLPTNVHLKILEQFEADLSGK